LGLTVAAMYPIANTHADQGIRDWYQHHVKQPGYQDWTDVGNKIGEWQFTIPIYLGAWAAGSLFDERPAVSVVGQWGERTMRGLAVGAQAGPRKTGRTGIRFRTRTASRDTASWAPCRF
jgi:hypothetical protein